MRTQFRRPWLFVILTFALFMLQASARSNDKIRVVAGIPPIAWAVDQVGGERVDITVLLPSGASPETYSPTPQALTGLSNARLMFTLGVAFEERLAERVQDFADSIAIIDVTNGIEWRQFDDDHHETDHGHDHGPADPHVWLDPVMMGTVIANVARGLSEIDSAHEGSYSRRADSAIGLLRALDQSLSNLLASRRGRSILVYHPSFGYFTDRYGLRQIAIERHGKEASARQLGELIALAKKERIVTLLTQPQFPKRQAEVVAEEIGAKVSVVDPLSRDYLQMMQDLGNQIAHSLGEKGGTK